MAIFYKTDSQIEQMYRAGQIVREVLEELGQRVAPGVTTGELDDKAQEICAKRNAKCLFKGYPGGFGAPPFPGAICASVNEEVVHGIPRADRVLTEGDIISVDFGVELDGWCGDAARTFLVGQVDPKVKKLVETTRRSLEIAVEMIPESQTWLPVAQAMQNFIENEGFSVVTDYVGHGIGKKMHEDPQIPNFVSQQLRRRDIKLRSGLVIAVEPMVNIGTHKCRTLDDGWTVVTADGKHSAHWENTIAITSSGVKLLTA